MTLEHAVHRQLPPAIGRGDDDRRARDFERRHEYPNRGFGSAAIVSGSDVGGGEEGGGFEPIPPRGPIATNDDVNRLRVDFGD